MFPLIMYHLTEGNRTDYGWGWRRVESQTEYDVLVKAGWMRSLSELDNEPILEGSTITHPCDIKEMPEDTLTTITNVQENVQASVEKKPQINEVKKRGPKKKVA